MLIRFINKSAIGFSVSILIWIFMFSINTILSNGGEFPENATIDAWEVVRELLLSGLIGVVGMGGSVIYEFESWGVLKTTVTHFVLSFSAFTVIAKVLGWFTPEATLEMVIIYVVMVIGYVIVWLVQYTLYKKEIRDINESLKRWRSSHADADV